MTWDFVEVNVFSASTGSWLNGVKWNTSTLESLPASADGKLRHHDAQTVDYSQKTVISTARPITTTSDMLTYPTISSPDEASSKEHLSRLVQCHGNAQG